MRGTREKKRNNISCPFHKIWKQLVGCRQTKVNFVMVFCVRLQYTGDRFQNEKRSSQCFIHILMVWVFDVRCSCESNLITSDPLSTPFVKKKIVSTWMVVPAIYTHPIYLILFCQLCVCVFFWFGFVLAFLPSFHMSRQFFALFDFFVEIQF